LLQRYLTLWSERNDENDKWDFNQQTQPSEHHEIVETCGDCTCCAVLFGNGAHHFSVCKALLTGWTVKDALVQECSHHSTFQAAIRHARQLHAKAQNYFVQAVLYYRHSL
jgi:hypothetical protein